VTCVRPVLHFSSPAHKRHAPRSNASETFARGLPCAKLDKASWPVSSLVFPGQQLPASPAPRAPYFEDQEDPADGRAVGRTDTRTGAVSSTLADFGIGAQPSDVAKRWYLSGNEVRKLPTAAELREKAAANQAGQTDSRLDRRAFHSWTRTWSPDEAANQAETDRPTGGWTARYFDGPALSMSTRRRQTDSRLDSKVV
jgi:hypothetical protein